MSWLSIPSNYMEICILGTPIIRIRKTIYKLHLHLYLLLPDLWNGSSLYNQPRSNIDGMIIFLTKHPKHYPEIKAMSCPNPHQKKSPMFGSRQLKRSYRHFIDSAIKRNGLGLVYLSDIFLNAKTHGNVFI